MWILATSTAFAQDVNCNGIDSAREPLVNLADPACAANIDPATGLPYTSADRYHDYVSLGCRLLLDDSYDIDGDGLGSGTVSFGGSVVSLQCDNCPSASNPDQADLDLDGEGDACEGGLPDPGPSDLNCNGIAASDEPLVDLADPVCAANIDPATGSPYSSSDRYYDYPSFGCTYLMDDGYDIDNDGLGTGLVSIGGASLVQLTCDNCPSTSNPDQGDSDLDGIGDVCVDQLYLGWPSPGVTGTPNELVVLEATPSSRVLVGVSDAPGAFPLPACGIDLALDSPFLFDVDVSLPEGVAFPTRNVPSAIAGKTVYFQAYEPATCRVSNVVAWSF
jgi:hypothetical protein